MRAVARWLADGRAQGWSARTLSNRELVLQQFAWWLEHEQGLPTLLASLSPTVLRSFLAYLREPSPAGRWGSDHPAAKREVRPSTVQSYYRILRAFLNFCVAEGLLEETPLKNVKTPRVPQDQVQPFSPDQLQLLVDGARRSHFPERDVLIVLLLVDTGMRVSELCRLTVGDVDRSSGELVVLECVKRGKPG